MSQPPDTGEIVPFDDPKSDITDTPDGGAMVKIDDSPKRGDSEFLSNLAETLPEPDLNRLATSLVELIGRDKEARAKRDKQYEEGIRRTGMGDDAPGGAQFEGASKVVHPLLTEVCVDFESKTIKELWPADGPVKSKIVGDVTKERVAKAQRKSDFMNWQLTVQAKGARMEFEQLLTQLPLGGGQYLKITWDEARNRPNFLFVPIDDIYLPYAASSFHTAQRKTHVQYITSLTYQQRVQSNMYRDVDVTVTSMVPEVTRAATANAKIEGKDLSSYNEDGLRTVFEIYVTCELDDDEVPVKTAAPYIVTVDKSSNKVLSIYRNWDEDDKSREELQWIVEFPFVPWRGAYPIGMIHMIGGLSAAATGSLRALLDSAHIQNSATMLKLKSTGGKGGQSLVVEPTQVLEIEGGLNTDDIRKLAMPMPFNPPSQTLFQLLGFVVDAAKGVVQTTLSDMADSTENTPVGTTLARVEQGMVVFSAIHGRLHNAMAEVLCVLHRLNGMYLDDREETEETGTLIASRADFSGPMDVVPVSDPNIFSEAQRFAQTQAVAQRAQLNPQYYKGIKVEQRILQTLKIPNYTELLVPEMTPVEENAVSENVKAVLGQPIVAFPAQDHIAHLMTHLNFMTSSVLGASQLMASACQAPLLNHVKEHIVLWYAAEVASTASDATDDDLDQMMAETKSPADKRKLDQLIAHASLNVLKVAPEALGQLQPVIAKAIQLIQQTAPKPPMDPAVEVAAQDVQMRGQTAQAKNATDQAKLADKAQDRLAEAQREQFRETQENARTEATNAANMEIKGIDGAQARTDAVLDFVAATHATETAAATDTHAAQLGAATDLHAANTQAQTALDTMPPPAPVAPSTPAEGA